MSVTDKMSTREFLNRAAEIGEQLSRKSDSYARLRTFQLRKRSEYMKDTIENTIETPDLLPKCPNCSSSRTELVKRFWKTGDSQIWQIFRFKCSDCKTYFNKRVSSHVLRTCQIDECRFCELNTCTSKPARICEWLK